MFEFVWLLLKCPQGLFWQVSTATFQTQIRLSTATFQTQNGEHLLIRLSMLPKDLLHKIAEVASARSSLDSQVCLFAYHSCGSSLLVAMAFTGVAKPLHCTRHCTWNLTVSLGYGRPEAGQVPLVNYMKADVIILCMALRNTHSASLILPWDERMLCMVCMYAIDSKVRVPITNLLHRP